MTRPVAVPLLTCVSLCLSLSLHSTLNSCTPIQANMNWSKVVTIMMLPIVLMATNTHWTTCCKGQSFKVSRETKYCRHKQKQCSAILFLTLSPLALLMALSGRRTLRTRRIFTTEIAEDLQDTKKRRCIQLT